ncbi:hypothetical protein OG909_25520 [Streptomyces sp. NBC_01754]|uniref:hypothetical protein n=1 Tax=Streptomyces sp. NBC_01754 TaxID=2975930 RepID=UPI002DDB5096|nr:hypothetical protein [Streptomyces sp. NBC_01754]WSC95372.1 hypothetical protein OG909_25520 [Streptomyces sp. NBC_01754]
MAGDTPFRKRRLRRTKSSEAHQGDPGPAEGARASAEHPAALSASPGTSDDERGRPASLEAVRAADPPRAPGRQGPDGTANRPGGARGLGRSVLKGGESARALAGRPADRIIDLAPRVPVRDLATLREQFPGLGPEELADRLVAGACNATATVGAGIGAAVMMPVPPVLPAGLAAEITGVAAVEMKLVAELHEVYGRRPPGGIAQRGTAYLTSWTEERRIDVSRPTTLDAAPGGRTKRELRRRITRRMTRDLPNLIPFLIGAAVGAVMNRRDTRKLADRVRSDLRRDPISWDRLPQPVPSERPEAPVKELPERPDAPDL